MDKQDIMGFENVFGFWIDFHEWKPILNNVTYPNKITDSNKNLEEYISNYIPITVSAVRLGPFY